MFATLATAALALYSVRTALAISKDERVKEKLSRTVTDASNALRKFNEATARARTERFARDLATRSDLILSQTFSRATEEERETMIEIMTKYSRPPE